MIWLLVLNWVSWANAASNRLGFREVDFRGMINTHIGIGITPASTTNSTFLDLDRVSFLILPKISAPLSVEPLLELEWSRRVNETHAVVENSDSVEHDELYGFSGRLRRAQIRIDQRWELGLISDPWLLHLESQLEFVNYGQFGLTGEEFFGLQSATDLGVSYSEEFAHGKFSVATFNGRGAGRAEEGSAKDIMTFLHYHNAGYHISLSHTEGRYDNLAVDKAKKNRTRLSLGADYKSFSLLLYGMQAEDNTAVVSRLNMFDAAHLSEELTLMKSDSKGAWIKVTISSSSSLLLNHEFWDPEKHFVGNEITRNMVAYIWHDLLSWSVSWVQLRYGDKFVNGLVRKDTEETLYLSAKLVF